MSTIYNGYYSLHYNEDVVTEELAQLLNEKLPHGSGINYDWTLEYYAPEGILAHNAYDAYNDGGYECHTWPFYVVLPIVEKFDNETDELLPIDEIDYQDETFADVVFINCDPENDCPNPKLVEEYYSQFEKDEDGDYSQEVCDNAPGGCGFGLQEYLQDTIYEALKY